MMGPPMDPSRISSDSLAGQLLRLPLRMIPRSAVVPILRGPLRGRKWVVGSAIHGCWLGSYEADKPERFAAWVKPGGVVYDVGANVGYYTLLAADRVGSAGEVVAFEPFPQNIAFLKRHLQLNGLGQVRVIEGAVSQRSGTARFEVGPTLAMGKLDATGELEVAVVALDELRAEGTLPAPDLIKMDIEGAEHDALLGARTLLAQDRPVLFLATHGPEVHRACCELLTELDYELESLDERPVEASDEILARPRT